MAWLDVGVARQETGGQCWQPVELAEVLLLQTSNSKICIVKSSIKWNWLLLMQSFLTDNGNFDLYTGLPCLQGFSPPTVHFNLHVYFFACTDLLSSGSRGGGPQRPIASLWESDTQSTVSTAAFICFRLWFLMLCVQLKYYKDDRRSPVSFTQKNTKETTNLGNYSKGGGIVKTTLNHCFFISGGRNRG